MDSTLRYAYNFYIRPLSEHVSCTLSSYHIVKVKVKVKVKQIDSVRFKWIKRSVPPGSLSYVDRLDVWEWLTVIPIWHRFGLVSYTALDLLTLTIAKPHIINNAHYTLYSTHTRGHAYKIYLNNNWIVVSKYLYHQSMLLALEQFNCLIWTFL